jgi:hypothetical protein
VTVFSALRPTTAGEVSSAIEAKALPICRRVVMLFSPSAKADSGVINSSSRKRLEITKGREKLLFCLKLSICILTSNSLVKQDDNNTHNRQ